MRSQEDVKSETLGLGYHINGYRYCPYSNRIITVNERIKKLAMQNERIWNLYTIGPVQRAEVEQFVELIIKECADFLKDKLDDHFAAEQLEEYFGVKE